MNTDTYDDSLKMLEDFQAKVDRKLEARVAAALVEERGALAREREALAAWRGRVAALVRELQSMLDVGV